MMPDSSTRLFAVVVILVIAAGISVGLSRKPVLTGVSDAARLQQLVGGLGFGSSVEMSTCAVQFDPRLEAACNAHTGPVPVGGLLCPGCGRFLFSFSPRLSEKPNGLAAAPHVLIP